MSCKRVNGKSQMTLFDEEELEMTCCNKKRVVVFIVLLFSIFAAEIYAQTTYVRPTGNTGGVMKYA